MARITGYTTSTPKVFNLPVIHQNNRVGFKNFAFDALAGFKPIFVEKMPIKLLFTRKIFPNMIWKKILYYQVAKSFWSGY